MYKRSEKRQKRKARKRRRYRENTKARNINAREEIEVNKEVESEKEKDRKVTAVEPAEIAKVLTRPDLKAKLQLDTRWLERRKVRQIWLVKERIALLLVLATGIQRMCCSIQGDLHISQDMTPQKRIELAKEVLITDEYAFLMTEYVYNACGVFLPDVLCFIVLEYSA